MTDGDFLFGNTDTIDKALSGCKNSRIKVCYLIK